MSKNQEISELPLVALIGPTNAGKSTLFNRLTGSWQAVTARESGTTRDRVYGEVAWNRKVFNLIDTGGIVEDESELNQRVFVQMQKASEEADIILFVYDAIEGLTASNKEYLNKLRGKNVWLVANKIDSHLREKKADRQPKLGLPYYEVSGATGRGTGDLLDAITDEIVLAQPTAVDQPIIAIIGRPNVGKSSILNTLTEQDRSVVSDVSGTTRDVVTEKITIDGQEFILADTAGIRRRGKIEVGAESFSVKRALTAINQATLVMVIVDASVGSTRGDLHLIYYAVELKKPTIIVFNKADLLGNQSVSYHGHISRYDHIVVSAKTGAGIDKLKDWIVSQAQKTA